MACPVSSLDYPLQIHRDFSSHPRRHGKIRICRLQFVLILIVNCLCDLCVHHIHSKRKLNQKETTPSFLGSNCLNLLSNRGSYFWYMFLPCLLIFNKHCSIDATFPRTDGVFSEGIFRDHSPMPRRKQFLNSKTLKEFRRMKSVLQHTNSLEIFSETFPQLMCVEQEEVDCWESMRARSLPLFLLRLGVPVAKHGNRASSGRFEVLIFESLHIQINPFSRTISGMCWEVGIGFFLHLGVIQKWRRLLFEKPWAFPHV